MKPDDLVGPTVIHSRGSIRYANRAFGDLVGVEPPEELYEASLTGFIATSDADPLLEAFERIDTEGVDTLSYRVTLTGDDSGAEAIAVSSPVMWENTPLIRTTFIDVSRREDGSISLRETALHEAPIGITIADVTVDDQPLVYVNDGFVDVTGYPREEVLGQNCRFLQGDDTRQKPVAKMRAALEAEQPITVELRNYRKDGSLFWNRVTLSPIKDETGNVTHYLGFQEDISEEKTHEQARFLFETYAETSDSAMFITEADGTIVYVNPAFERVTGYTADEAIGNTPRILKSGEQGEAFYEELWTTITAGETWRSEIINRTKSGELYDTTQEITPITDDRGDVRYYVAIERDITDQQLREQVLNVLNRILRHNVRNSVTVIDGYAEFIQEDPDGPDVKAAATTIREHATTLRQLTEQTATIRTLIALLEGDKPPSPIRLSEAESIIERYSGDYDEAVIDIVAEGRETSTIRYGAVFEVAIGELIENAVKHNDRTSPRVEVTITETGQPGSAEAIIEVADNGPEIPESEWEIIKSGEETQLRHTEGIGLWVVYWSVTALGGTVNLSRNEPRGNVITVRIPVASAPEPSET